VHLQYCALLNSNHLRLRCSCTPVPVNLNFVVISPFFAIFKNVVHGMEPGETPSSSFLNIAKHDNAVCCGCSYFLNLLKFSTCTVPVLRDNLVQFRVR